MSMPDKFKKLDAWKKSIELTVKIYQVTLDFPENEMNGITDQIRRAATSITNNISEGAGLGSMGRKLYHFDIAFGSSNEVDNLAVLSKELGYIDSQTFDELEDLIESTRKPLSGLINHTKKKINDAET
jgi:four helix bundle protein